MNWAADCRITVRDKSEPVEAFDAQTRSQYNRLAEVKLMAMDTKDKVAIPTDHPHVVRVAGVCGGEPIVDGLRVRVVNVVGYYRLHHSVDEILETLPFLTREQVLDALAYAKDHPDEIGRLMVEDALAEWEEEIEQMVSDVQLPAGHPHVVRVDGVARVRGSSMRVASVFETFCEREGIEGVLEALPSLTREQVVDALDYTREHPDEIGRQMMEAEIAQWENLG
jgi:uncharacterized protein (DUF433 family)